MVCVLDDRLEEYSEFSRSGTASLVIDKEDAGVLGVCGINPVLGVAFQNGGDDTWAWECKCPNLVPELVRKSRKG